MTSSAAIAAVVRRWYVVVAGAVATFGLVASIHSATPIYSTQADVVFLAPLSRAHPNPMGSTSESLIATAGLVSHLVNAGRSEAPTASAGVALTGEGVREGWSVRLPDAGGQWSHSFSRPVLDVQVVGASPSRVRAALAGRIEAIDAALAAIQDADDIPVASRIETSSAPDLATVILAAGDPARASAAAVLLGTVLTGLATLTVDRLLPTRRRPRRPAPIPHPSHGTATA